MAEGGAAGVGASRGWNAPARTARGTLGAGGPPSAPPRPSTAGLRRLWWIAVLSIGGLFALGVGLRVVAAAASVQEGAAWGSASPIGAFLFTLVVTTFPVTGALIVRRQPANRVGWVLLAIGASWSLDLALQGFATMLWLQRHALVRLSQALVAIDQVTWIPAVGLTAFLLLLFPDGGLPSRRWRPVAWVAGVDLVAAVILMVLSPLPVEGSGYPEFANPFGVRALRGSEPVGMAAVSIIPVAILAAASSLVGRFRRSGTVERLQMKWLAAAGSIVALLYLASMAASAPFWMSGATDERPIVLLLENAALLSFALLPLAVGIAILKHRLYDIDRIINRAIVYGLLTALLAGAYVGLAVGLGSLSGSENSLVIAGSTLVVAALFRPARSRIQATIDRRFYRRKYDAERTLAAFGARLRDQVDLEELHAHLLAAVGRTVQPASMSLWLSEGEGGSRSGVGRG